MNYTYCERLMWHALTPAMFHYLRAHEPTWDLSALKKQSKKEFCDMVSHTPDIGSLKENALRICLSAGMVWLSVYKAADGKMSDVRFSEIVNASMATKLMKISFQSKGKTTFSLVGQQKRAANAEKSNALSKSPFNWRTEVILGRDADEFSVLYHQCGLCALARQEGLMRLMPAMCVLDIQSVEWMGGVLYRTKTLAEGGDCCDFYICRKGSQWDLEKQQSLQAAKNNETGYIRNRQY